MRTLSTPSKILIKDAAQAGFKNTSDGLATLRHVIRRYYYESIETGLFVPPALSMAKDAFAEEAGKGTPAPVAETKTCTARIVEQAEENEASRIESAFNRRQSTARGALGRAGLSVAVGTPGGIAFHHASHLLDTMDSVLCLTLLTFAVLTAWDKFCRSLRMKASKVVRALAPEKVCGVKREVDSFFKRLDNELEIRQKS